MNSLRCLERGRPGPDSRFTFIIRWTSRGLQKLLQASMKRVASIVRPDLNPRCAPRKRGCADADKVAWTSFLTAWFRHLSAGVAVIHIGARSSIDFRRSVLDLANAIQCKQTSRGMGPVLWKWASRQPWRHLQASPFY